MLYCSDGEKKEPGYSKKAHALLPIGQGRRGSHDTQSGRAMKRLPTSLCLLCGLCIAFQRIFTEPYLVFRFRRSHFLEHTLGNV